MLTTTVLALTTINADPERSPPWAWGLRLRGSEVPKAQDSDLIELIRVLIWQFGLSLRRKHRLIGSFFLRD